MRSIDFPSLRFTLPALLALPLTAQTASLPAPGYQLTSLSHPVGLFDAHASLPTGERIVFDGVTVQRVAEDGTPLATLASFATFAFPSFVVLDPTATSALIGESDFGWLYRVDLVLGGAQPVADLDFNYDAVFEDGTHALVSAAPCGFNCGSTIQRVDLMTGSLTLVATVTGASGPLVLSTAGELLYGLQPPSVFAPPGSWSIVSWSAAQIHSGSVLTQLDAALFCGGLDGASSLTLDPVYGHLFVAESPFTGTSHVRAIDRSGSVFGSVVESLGFVTKLEAFSTAGAGALQAFQPPGMELRFRTTDYGAGTSAVERVAPRRPVATTSGPGLNGPGPVTFAVTGAVPNANFLVLLGPLGSYTPTEVVTDTGVFLFHTGLHSIRRTGLFVPTDANGDGSFTFINPGTLQGTRALQAVVRDANNRFVGTSTAAFL